MSRAIQLLVQLIALAILVCALYFGYLLIDSNNQTRLAVLTAVVSVSGLIYTQNLTSKREIASRQFAKKAEAYEEIMGTIAELINSNRKGEEVDEADLIEKLATIIPKLMVWAGPDVLVAWKQMTTPTDDPLGGLKAGTALISALRKELGHENDAQLGQFGAFSAMLKYDGEGNIL